MTENHASSHQDMVREAAGLRQEITELRQRLEEAEQTLNAIRNGEVDALVVDTKLGEKIFTLEGADTVYRTAIENINEGTVTISQEGTILFSNNYFAQMMHTDLNKVIGASIFDFVSQGSRDLFNSMFLRDSTHNELSFIAQDGVQIPTLVSTKKIQLDVPTICAVITDLTQQKRDEEIINGARLLQSILAQSTEAVIVCDEKGTIIHTSMEAQKLVGHFTVGSKFDEEFKFLKTDDYPITLSTLQSGRIANQTEINIVSEGRTKTFLIAHAKLAVEDIILGHVITLTDITFRKMAEEELRRRESELEASNNELEAFSYSVSHDLRAPLRSMAGFSGALLEQYADKLEAEGKLYLNKIQESSVLMGQMIEDLLKLAGVTSTAINSEKLNLSEMAQKTVKELQAAEPERKVKVMIKSDLIAYGDRVLLRRVIDNLLGNAWKFSSKAIEPQIEMGSLEHDGKQAYFVRDNGAGFNMAYVDKLFKPFQRLHATSDFAGTGIGLAIVRRIIRRHGGEVWAEGKVGEGATFYFTLN